MNDVERLRLAIIANYDGSPGLCECGHELEDHITGELCTIRTKRNALCDCEAYVERDEAQYQQDRRDDAALDRAEARSRYGD